MYHRLPVVSTENPHKNTIPRHNFPDNIAITGGTDGVQSSSWSNRERALRQLRLDGRVCEYQMHIRISFLADAYLAGVDGG